MKIYLGCALSHVPRQLFDEYTAFVHALAASVQNIDGVESVKYALVDSDPQLAEKSKDDRARLCYLWDRAMIEDADLVIAESSFSSIGLGIEMQIAEANDTPLIIAFRNFGTNKATPVHYRNPDMTEHKLQIGDGTVSLMAIGMPNLFDFLHYESPEDGLRLINKSVERFLK